MTTEKQVVFVVNDGQHVLGVYGTKEKAQADGIIVELRGASLRGVA